MMDTDHGNNLSVLPSVFTVVPRLRKSKLVPLEVTPIKRLDTIDPVFLPKFHATNNMSNIYWVHLDARTAAEWGMTSYYVKIQKSPAAAYRLGVLFKYDTHIYGILRLQKDLKLKNLKDLRDDAIRESRPGVFALETHQLQENTDLDLSGFTMAPPTADPANSSPAKEDTSDDPNGYMQDKYFSALYSNADLMFFAKSTFARLKVLCTSAGSTYELTLLAALLDVEQFKQRYDVTSKVFFQLKRAQSAVESRHKSRFLESNSLHGDDMNSVKDKLKMREIELQLIVLMELVLLRQRDAAPSVEIKQSTKTKKASLVRKRNKKRTLVPTLIGTVVELDSVEETNQPKELTLDAVKSAVRKYLDLLIVVDSMRETGSSANPQHTKQHSMIIDFLANIIVPFYYKKAPDLCKELIKTVKGVSMKKKPKKKAVSLQPAISLPMRAQSPPNQSLASGAMMKAPSLVKTKSSLEGFLDEKPSLKRSTSLISSTKMLEKRMIDFSAKSVSSSQASAQDSVGIPKVELPKKPSRGIFGTKAAPKESQEPLKKSFLEIGETPVKKQKPTVIDMTVDSQDSSFKKKLFEVAATPDNRSTKRQSGEVIGSADASGISSSPVSLMRNSAINEIAASAQMIPSSPPTPTNDTQADITSSPVKAAAPAQYLKPTSSAIRRKQRDLKGGFAPLKKRKINPGDFQEIPPSPKPGEPIKFLKYEPYNFKHLKYNKTLSSLLSNISRSSALMVASLKLNQSAFDKNFSFDKSLVCNKPTKAPIDAFNYRRVSPFGRLHKKDVQKRFVQALDARVSGDQRLEQLETFHSKVWVLGEEDAQEFPIHRGRDDSAEVVFGGIVLPSAAPDLDYLVDVTCLVPGVLHVEIHVVGKQRRRIRHGVQPCIVEEHLGSVHVFTVTDKRQMGIGEVTDVSLEMHLFAPGSLVNGTGSVERLTQLCEQFDGLVLFAKGKTGPDETDDQSRMARLGLGLVEQHF